MGEAWEIVHFTPEHGWKNLGEGGPAGSPMVFPSYQAALAALQGIFVNLKLSGRPPEALHDWRIRRYVAADDVDAA